MEEVDLLKVHQEVAHPDEVVEVEEIQGEGHQDDRDIPIDRISHEEVPLTEGEQEDRQVEAHQEEDHQEGTQIEIHPQIDRVP